MLEPLSNTIANNGNASVNLMASGVSTGNQVILNSIYNNTGLGIDLGTSGVTVNNGTKSVSLPNNDMDFPVFAGATLSGTTLSVCGFVGSSPGQSVFGGATVQVFKSDGYAGGYGEGRAYLGTLTADARGRFSGAIAVPSGITLADADQITATATDGSSNTSEFGFNVTIPYQSRSVFNHAICSNALLSDYTSGNRVVVTGSGGANGDISANNSISFTTGGTTVNGNAEATGAISVAAVTGTQKPGASALPFPAIDLAYYQSIAGRTFNSSQSFSGFTFNSPDEVVYVNGSITLNGGTINGTGTLVASGSVTLSGTTTYGSASAKMAVITPVSFGGSGPCSVVGIYYAHNASITASASLGATGANKSVNLSNGAWVADSFTFGNSSNAAHDPTITAFLGQQLHLPGY